MNHKANGCDYSSHTRISGVLSEVLFPTFPFADTYLCIYEALKPTEGYLMFTGQHISSSASLSFIHSLPHFSLTSSLFRRQIDHILLCGTSPGGGMVVTTSPSSSLQTLGFWPFIEGVGDTPPLSEHLSKSILS